VEWFVIALFSADDFVFWFDDISSHKEIVPAPIPDMQPKGKPGRIVKVNDLTVRFEFDVPCSLFKEMTAADTNTAGGRSVRRAPKLSFGAYSPEQYLKQFLPKQPSLDAVNTKAEQDGFENRMRMLHFTKYKPLNIELPTLGPWKTVQPITTPIWLLERNPLHYSIDTAGDRLPCIERIQLSLGENLDARCR
jgi:peptide/nickel transport system substrate-binding protein